MQSFRRTERINVILRRYISEIISRDMKDPRLASIITIVDVMVSKDLRHAKVFTSVMDNRKKPTETIETLNSAAGFIRQNIMPKLRTKNVPHLRFFLDDSIEKGNYLLGKIDTVVNQHGNDEGATK